MESPRPSPFRAAFISPGRKSGVRSGINNESRKGRHEFSRTLFSPGGRGRTTTLGTYLRPEAVRVASLFRPSRSISATFQARAGPLCIPS
jgi:hypothetical protein